MTPKYLVLVLAALCLVACETTDVKAPISKRIVRMAPIPDEPDARLTRTAASVAAPAGKATAVRHRTAPAPAPAAVPTTETSTTDSAPTAETTATPTPATPAPTETLPIEPVPTEPTTMAATPDAPPPGETPVMPAVSGFDLSAITDLMRAAVGGMPIWLIGLIAVALLAALLFGFRGRKARDPYSGAEPETA